MKEKHNTMPSPLFVALLSLLPVLTQSVYPHSVKELSDQNFKDTVTNSGEHVRPSHITPDSTTYDYAVQTDKHVVVLWREGGIKDVDEIVRAYMDAARQFEVRPLHQTMTISM